MSDLLKKTESYIKENRMLDIESGFRVIAGVSGGADSVCLLLLLKALAGENSYVAAVHVNHNLRGEAALEDRRFVEDLCKKLDLPCFCFSEDVAGYAGKYGLSLEDAGRKLRYERLAETALSLQAKIAVAHHMDDNAETVLFHLIRGAGLKGISGMQPESRQNGCEIIRPLLGVSRKEIEEYLEEKKQSFRNDETNEDLDIARNRIRHAVLTELKKINPQAAKHICMAAEHAAGAEQYIVKQAEAVLEKAGCAGGQFPAVSAAVLNEADDVVKDAALYKMLSAVAGTEKDLAQIHIMALKKLLAQPSGKQIMLPHGVLAVKENEKIVFKKQQDAKECEPVCIRIPKDLNGKTKQELMLPDGKTFIFEILPLKSGEMGTYTEKNLYTKAFDYDTITGSLFIGTKTDGDKITLQNGSKSISRYMIDRKIPKAERMKILLLKDEKEVLWVTGFRINESYKLTERTRKILKVTLTGADLPAENQNG